MTDKIPPLASKQLEELLEPINLINPHPENYKSHPLEQLTHLKASLRAFGFTKPIFANIQGQIVAGHGMYQAALEEGYTHVPVLRVTFDSKTSKAYIVADNETARKAVTDSDKLNDLLQEISEIPDFNIESVGFSVEDIELLITVPDSFNLQNNNNSEYSSSNQCQNYEIPEDSPEYNESIANEVKACVCPKCGFKFPDKV